MIETINIILGAANAIGIVAVFFKIGKFTGVVETDLKNHAERIKRIEDRCEERCLIS